MNHETHKTGTSQRLTRLGIPIALAMLVLPTVAVADAVQWTEAEGGNGHWYEPFAISGLTWTESSLAAEAAGGHLATLTSSEENQFLFQVVEPIDEMWEQGWGNGSWLGAYQDLDSQDYDEPAGGWRWVTGEAVDYFNWDINQPDDSGGVEHFLIYRTRSTDAWNDHFDNLPTAPGYIIEWSADCTGDGIVDYGQILDGSLVDDNDNGVPDSCELDHVVPDHYPSIQAAIDQTEPGTVIQVRSGTYLENIISNSPIILRSLDGPEATIIDGSQSGTVVQLAGGQPHAIDGFTVTNGVGPANTAGGILISGGTHLAIRNCIISDNTHVDGEYGGGGLKLDVGTLQMSNCEFRGNSSNWNGGAVYIWHSCCVYITDCTFTNHVDGGSEYGPLDVVHIQNDSTASISGCVFDGNRFRDSEIVVWDGANATVTNCEFLNGQQTEPTQPGKPGSVFSGAASSLAIGSNYACEHPEPHVTIDFTDLGGNDFTDEPCDTVIDCNLNGIEDADDIADGTSQDCNTNGIPDECDIDEGLEEDCNLDGVPDSCQTLSDCDADGIPDACEILNGATDINPSDGIPDDCQGAARGACCIDTMCVLTTASDCFDASGSYAGDGVSCTEGACGEPCPGDIDGNGIVDVIDILTVLNSWGGCP